MTLKRKQMRLKYYPILFTIISCTLTSRAQESPIEIVQRQLDTYNRQDIVEFSSLFAENAQVFMALGDTNPSMIGREEIHERYGKMFSENPNNKSTLLGRMVQGDYVFDHEWITGREDPFKIMAIYEVKEGLIQRCWFIR